LGHVVPMMVKERDIHEAVQHRDDHVSLDHHRFCDHLLGAEVKPPCVKMNPQKRHEVNLNDGDASGIVISQLPVEVSVIVPQVTSRNDVPPILGGVNRMRDQ